PEQEVKPSTPAAGPEVRTGLGKLVAVLGAGWARGVALVQQAVGWTAELLGQGFHACRVRVQAAGQAVKAAVRGGWQKALAAAALGRRVWKPLLAGLGVALAAGVGCLLAGPVVWLVSGLTGTALCLVALALCPFWSAFAPAAGDGNG